MIPILMGLAGAGVMGMGMIQSLAPDASSAVGAVVTPEIINARQRELSKNPTMQLTTSELVQARHKGLISNNTFYDAMHDNGINNNRANTLLEVGKPLIQLNELATSYYKNNLTQEDYLEKAKRLGYTTNEAKLFLYQQRSAISTIELVIAYWRKLLSLDGYIDKMRENGYNKGDALIILQTQYYLPSHEDLIRFQIRDVYNPKIVEKYGYNEEFPESILEDAAKIGMSKDVMQKYWAAHWQLPSPTMAYEMLHRLHPDVLKITAPTYDFDADFMRSCQTDVNTIDEMLKIADYPKYWRNRLIALSYHALTRVDLKRLFKLGIIEDDYVVATLREDGYSEYDAKKLLEYYKYERHGKDKALSQTQLLKAYNYGYISYDQLVNELRDLNYNDNDIAVLIAVNKQKLEEKDFKDILKVYEAEYQAGLLSIEDVKNKLLNRRIEQNKIDIITAKFILNKRKKVKTAPLKDIHQFFQSDIINESEYRELLSEYGLSNKYIELYIKLYTQSEQNTEN